MYGWIGRSPLWPNERSRVTGGGRRKAGEVPEFVRYAAYLEMEKAALLLLLLLDCAACCRRDGSSARIRLRRGACLPPWLRSRLRWWRCRFWLRWRRVTRKVHLVVEVLERSLAVALAHTIRQRPRSDATELKNLQIVHELARCEYMR